jgi:serine/threonine protein kinase
LREARAAASVRHPNVVSVFHLGRAGQNYFYAMEFVEGETLEHLIKRSGRWTAGHGVATRAPLPDQIFQSPKFRFHCPIHSTRNVNSLSITISPEQAREIEARAAPERRKSPEDG